ncbi:MAG: hypothetical protein M1118_06125 [Chloroflexi bacterium]|nr:hypothetical protein [Chloroflexota bacterium]
MSSPRHPQTLLADLSVGLLPPDAAEHVWNHVNNCDECRKFLVSLEATGSLLRNFPIPPLPRSFVLPANTPRPSPWGWLGQWQRQIAAVAAAVLLTLSVVIALYAQSVSTSTTTTRSVLSSAAVTVATKAASPPRAAASLPARSGVVHPLTSVATITSTTRPQAYAAARRAARGSAVSLALFLALGGGLAAMIALSSQRGADSTDTQPGSPGDNHPPPMRGA